MSRNRLNDRCNRIVKWYLWQFFNHYDSSLIEIAKPVTAVSIIAYSVVFNVFGGKLSLWLQTNPEMVGLEGVSNPFIYYDRKICI